MANLGTDHHSPYSKMELDNQAAVASDTPYPLRFTGNLQTGFYKKSGTGQFGIGSNGREAASVQDATFTVTYFAQGVASGLTAAGTSIAGALQLSSAINFVGNAVTGTGCALPYDTSIGVGTGVTVFNDGANAIQIYAQNSATIDGVAGATGVPLSATKRAVFIVKSSGVWISAQLGAVSA